MFKNLSIFFLLIIFCCQVRAMDIDLPVIARESTTDMLQNKVFVSYDSETSTFAVTNFGFIWMAAHVLRETEKKLSHAEILKVKNQIVLWHTLDGCITNNDYKKLHRIPGIHKALITKKDFLQLAEQSQESAGDDDRLSKSGASSEDYNMWDAHIYHKLHTLMLTTYFPQSTADIWASKRFEDLQNAMFVRLEKTLSEQTLEDFQ